MSVTVAPGITPPCESLTVPITVAVVICASAVLGISTYASATIATAITPRIPRTMSPPHPWADNTDSCLPRGPRETAAAAATNESTHPGNQTAAVCTRIDHVGRVDASSTRPALQPSAASSRSLKEACNHRAMRRASAAPVECAGRERRRDSVSAGTPLVPATWHHPVSFEFPYSIAAGTPLTAPHGSNLVTFGFPYVPIQDLGLTGATRGPDDAVGGDSRGGPCRGGSANGDAGSRLPAIRGARRTAAMIARREAKGPGGQTACPPGSNDVREVRTRSGSGAEKSAAPWLR